MTRIDGAAARDRFRWITLVRAALMAALLVPGYVSDALAAGAVSGQITSSVTHSGIAGATVQFYDVNSNDSFPVATATADGGGNYVQNLPDGSYGVLTQNTQGYINKIWNNISCSATCDVNSLTPVVVSGGAVTGISFQLDPGGRIAGTITASATGNPIAGALVYFLDSAGNVPFSMATTDSQGHYTSDGGTATGSVFVITGNGQGYQDESYNDHKCTLFACSAADPVSVTLGATTNGVDFALDVGGRISGTVKDANGSSLANVQVRTYDSNGNQVDAVFTDGSGSFITSGVASGTYYVVTRNSLGLVDYVWNSLVCARDSCNETQGTPIPVTVPSTTTGVNFVLSSGQTISGTVTAASGGAPLADVFVALANASGAFVGGANSDNTGAFTTGAVPPGTYFANVLSNGYVQQFYNHISCPNGCGFAVGTPIVVSNQPVTNTDFSLIATGTGSITGTVIDGLNNNLPTGLSVQLFSPGGQFVASTTTSSGVYTFSNVAAGSYYVRTNASGILPDGSSFINRLYNGVTCVNCAVATSGGTLVTVTNGAATSGIDFTLSRGGLITGTVTNAADGTPLSGIGVQVFNSAGLGVGVFNTNGSGVFTTMGLPPGTYYVRTSNNAGYINQQWHNLPCPQSGCLSTAGTPVVVSGTATTTGIDFALSLGGRISGKVTDASNSQALPSVTITVFSSSGVNLGSLNTDGLGNFTTSGLAPGSYYLRASSNGVTFQNNQPVAFVDQLYGGTPCPCLNPTLGTPVAVTSGATTSGINFALSRGGSIAGGVIDAATGVGLGSIAVQIYTSAGALMKTAVTNTAGGYTLAGLPPGTYYARTSMPNGVFYQDGLYRGMACSAGCSVTAGTPITVLSGVISNGVDFALSLGAGGISGTITDVRTGAPLAGVSVQIYSASGVYTKTAVANVAGMYATAGLAPGTYYARTVQETIPSSHADQLYSGQSCSSGCTVTSGTPIVVAAGATTSGIDFGLGPIVVLMKADARIYGPRLIDFDADRKADFTVWRPSTGTWYVSNSSNAGVTARTWGAGYDPYNDIAVPGDYDGDGKIDFAVWRSSTGTWYVVNSSNGSVTTRTWGAGYAPFNDVPVPGDYDGDGKTDIAVWRASTGTWYVLNSSDGSVTARTWGAGFAPFNDVPVPGDYDGDGKTDIAVWRASTGTWYVLNSSNGSVTTVTWGAGSSPYNDVPVPGDYDGDGRTDIAVWRPSTGTWYVINSSNGSVTTRQWGAGFAPYNDVPIP